MKESEKLLILSRQIKPCPFCKSKVLIQKVCNKKLYYIECAECELTFGKLTGIECKFSNVDDLVAAWERRASDD